MPEVSERMARDLADIELTPADAALVMEAVVENTYRLLPIWPEPDDNGQTPIAPILDELLTIDDINGFVKSRIRWVQKALSILEEGRSEVSPAEEGPIQTRGREMLAAMEGAADIPTKLESLRRFRREAGLDGDSGDGDEPGILRESATERVVADTLIGVIDHGQGCVLWPDHPVFRTILEVEGVTPMGGRNGGRLGAVNDVAEASAQGLIAGAAGGAVVGAVLGPKGAAAGAAAGGVAGAVAGGVSEVGRKAISWVRRRRN